jgi:hypothetical protein
MRIGGRASDDDPRLFGEGEAADFVHIDGFAFAVDGVGDEVVEAAAEVDGGAVGEVATLAEFHAHDGVAGVHEGEVGGHVGFGAAGGLHVCVFGAEEFLRAVDGELFELVAVDVAGVVALTGVALGVFVREDGTRGLEDGRGSVVFARDHFERFDLAGALIFDDGYHGRVYTGKRRHHYPRRHRWGLG